eukprot:scaffold87400_cov51-Phaeocystis_antarctica.AAC.1
MPRVASRRARSPSSGFGANGPSSKSGVNMDCSTWLAWVRVRAGVTVTASVMVFVLGSAAAPRGRSAP